MPTYKHVYIILHAWSILINNLVCHGFLGSQTRRTREPGTSSDVEKNGQWNRRRRALGTAAWFAGDPSLWGSWVQIINLKKWKSIHNWISYGFISLLSALLASATSDQSFALSPAFGARLRPRRKPGQGAAPHTPATESNLDEKWYSSHKKEDTTLKIFETYCPFGTNLTNLCSTWSSS